MLGALALVLFGRVLRALLAVGAAFGLGSLGGGLGFRLLLFLLLLFLFEEMRLDLAHLVARWQRTVHGRAVEAVVRVLIRCDGGEIGLTHAELHAVVVEVERRVLAAHVAAIDELVPALLAVALLDGRGVDGHLAALADVAEPLVTEAWLGIDRRLECHRAEVGPGVRRLDGGSASRLRGLVDVGGVGDRGAACGSRLRRGRL